MNGDDRPEAAANVKPSVRRVSRNAAVARAHDETGRACQLATLVLEALEVGDQDMAVSLCLSELEDGPRARPCRCRVCGAAFEWPGLLTAHQDRAGHYLELERAA